MPRSQNQPPKVFISHAGQDKERFVLQFAERLRAKGVEAWLDIWEMNPGDSLVDKIFEEGLKGCDAMIVVLSNHSITSKWVREELNTGVVKKIEDKTKLIPIRLDRCAVPGCLMTTIWQDIPDLNNYDEQFERILNAIYGQYEKPPLGERPSYVRPDVLEIGDLTRINSVIFETACRLAIEEDSPLINADPLVAALAKQGVSQSQIIETQEILDGRGFIHLHRTHGPSLGEIAEWCEENGWPPLNSLALNRATGMPGVGYDGAPGSDLLLWPEQVRACIAFAGYPDTVSDEGL